MGTTHQLTDHRSFTRIAITLLATLSLLAAQLVVFSGFSPAAANTNVPDSLDQWANGSPGQDPAVSGGWQNGNLNVNNSQYAEGDSVAFRRELGGDRNRQFEPGEIYRVSINYDTINGGDVAYDYLTSWDRTEPEADPRIGTGSRYAGVTEHRLAIPPDPRLASTLAFSQSLAGPREMSAFGAELLFVGNYRYSSGTAADAYPSTGTTTTTIDIVFRAEQGAVMLAWGGHIAQQSDWDAAAGYDTAPRSTQGSPYHMRNTGSIQQLTAVDGEVINSNNAGNQDRSIKASAVLIPGLNLSKGVLDPGSFEVNAHDQIVVTPDQEFTYSLVVTNDGESSSQLQSIVVTDAVPSIFEIQDVTGPDCSFDGQDVTCTIPSLLGGQSVSILIDVKVVIDPTDEDKVCGLYENDATAASGDLVEQDSFVIDVQGCEPELDIEKDVVASGEVVHGARDETTPAEFGSGDSFVYRLTVTAAGTAIAESVEVTDEIKLPLEVDVDDLDERCAYDADDRTVTCDLGDLAPGESATIDILVSVPAFDACDPTDNVASVTTTTLDAEGEAISVDSNLVYVDITGCAPDLTFAKALAPQAPSSIDIDGTATTTFRLSVSNASDATATATGVAISDTIPTGLVFDSLSNTEDCAYDADDREVTCTDIDLAPGDSFMVDITVRADAAALSLGDDGTLCGTITNTATFSYDDTTTDRTADVTLTGCASDVAIEKSVELVGSTIDVDGSDTATYTIEVDNDDVATATATGVSVTDTIDDAFTIVGTPSYVLGEADAVDCTVDGQEVTCGPVDLAPGETLTVTIEVQAAGDVCGTFPNTATVTYDDAGTGEEELSSTSDDEVDVRIIGCESRVALDKDVDVDGAIDIYDAMSDGAATVSYTITATVSGELEAEDLVISDELPAPLVLVGTPTYQVGEADAVDCVIEDGSDRSFDCNVGTAAPGDVITVTVDARVPTGSFDVCGPMDNTATVGWSFEDDEGATSDRSDEASASFDLVGCVDYLAFDKSATPEVIDAKAADDEERRVTYVLRAWNGPTPAPVSVDATATAMDVTISDDLAELIAYGGFSVVDVAAELDGEELDGLCSLDLTEGLDCAPVDLAPGAELVVTLVLQVDASDENTCTAEPLVNEAFASWTLAYPGEDGPATDQLSDSAEIELTGCEAGIVLDKSATAVVADELVVGEVIQLEQDGDKLLLVELDGEVDYVIDYTFEVTNTGNVTLYNVTLDDPLLGGPLTLSTTTLAPGATATAIATYEVTAEDIAAGGVPNTATATGQDRPEDGATVSDVDTDTVFIVEVLDVALEPGIEVVKEALIDVDEDGIKTVTVGDDGTAEIVYRYTITNTGDADLFNVTLVDDVIGDLTDELSVTFLAVGESTVVDVPYTTTAAELAAGRVDNIATTTGTTVEGATAEAQDDETVFLVEVLDTVEPLPRTGADTWLLTAVGLLLTLLGAATLLLGTRRGQHGEA